MGCDFQYLKYLAKKRIFDRKSRIKVLDIGTQNLYLADKQEIVAFLKEQGTFLHDNELEKYAELVADGSGYVEGTKGFKNGAFLGDLLEKINVSYLAFDIFSAPNTEIFDLNEYNLPVEYRDNFNLVLNFGTTEHVFNQYNAFKVIHEATAKDGFIFHQLPAIGYIDHGYFMYSPKFFTELAAANEYELLDMWFSGPQSYSKAFDTVAAYENLIKDSSKPHNNVQEWEVATIPNSVLNVLLKKKKINSFRLPLECSTSIGATHEQLSFRYSGASGNVSQVFLERYNLNKFETIDCSIDNMPFKNIVKILAERIFEKIKSLARKFLGFLRRKISN